MKTRLRCKHTFFFAAVLSLAVIAPLASTVLQPSSAAETGFSDPIGGVKASYYNGYYIENKTDEKLVFTKDSVQQIGTTTCQGKLIPPFYECTAYGLGFGERPPQTIEPGARGYFEIPVYVYNGHTIDDTQFAYKTEKSGQEFQFHPDVSLIWHDGTPYFNTDESDCSSAQGYCFAQHSTKRGKKSQTVFDVYSSPLLKELVPAG